MLISKALEGFKLSCLAKGSSPETIKGYEWAFKLINEYLDSPELESIKAKDLQRFFLHLHTETNLSASSIQKVWTCVRAFYNWAVDEFNIDRPDKEIPMPKADTKEVIPFTEAELIALLKVTKRIRDRALLLTLLDTGLRVSELARLRVRDLNLDNGAIEVKPYRTGHKSKTRIVFLGIKTRKAIWRYLADRDTKLDEPLFLSRDGNPLNRNSIRQLINRIGIRANIKAYPHKFRHTFAVNFLKNGGDAFTLQYLLGHTDLTMTKRYVRLASMDTSKIHLRSPVDCWKLG